MSAQLQMEGVTHLRHAPTPTGGLIAQIAHLATVAPHLRVVTTSMSVLVIMGGVIL